MVAEPSYDMRPCTIDVVRGLCERHHGYGSAGSAATYAFAVYEYGAPVAAYAWQPPPPGAAKAVAPDEPGGVLALSRMVAVPRHERSLRHVSRPLRRQMRVLIDRGRWPALVTYSDEGQGHIGHVYKCSGWQPTARSRARIYEDERGRRVSRYRNGRHDTSGLTAAGHTWIQRWEHHVTEDRAGWMRDHGWRREPTGKLWRSGTPAMRWVNTMERGMQMELGGWK